MMRAGRLLLIILLAGSSVAGERPRRPPVRWAPTAAASAGLMSIAFVDVPGGAGLSGAETPAAALNIGPVSRAGALAPDVSVTPTATGFVVSSRFGMVVHDGATMPRTASIVAATVKSRVRVFIDDVPLDTAPRLIASHVIPERVIVHRIRIEVPADVDETESQLFRSLLFSVVPE